MDEEKGKNIKVRKKRTPWGDTWIKGRVKMPVWKPAYEALCPNLPNRLTPSHCAAMIYSHLPEMADRWHLDCYFWSWIICHLLSASFHDTSIGLETLLCTCVLKRKRGFRNPASELWNQTTDLLQVSIRFKTVGVCGEECRFIPSLSPDADVRRPENSPRSQRVLMLSDSA